MLVGVDFDNTLVCYDRVFHETAVRRGLIPAAVPPRKEQVRDHLRRCGREGDWTELQGFIYGPGMTGADLFPGAMEFLRACRERKVGLVVVSHKTRRPYLGPPHDLHGSARAWLEAQGFHDPARIGMPPGSVHFELTKEAKLERIRRLGCDFFIDDLPEFLSEPGFPTDVTRILFHPGATVPAGPWTAAASWDEIRGIVMAAANGAPR